VTDHKERSPGIVLLGRDPGAEVWRGVYSDESESRRAAT
jgi:hypothetical protein